LTLRGRFLCACKERKEERIEKEDISEGRYPLVIKTVLFFFHRRSPFQKLLVVKLLWRKFHREVG